MSRMATTWCPVCRTYLPPSRSQAEHDATNAHRANVREPERRVRAGWRGLRAELQAVGR